MIRHRFAALVALAAVTLSACGTTENPGGTDAGAADEQAAGGPVTVTDSRGKEITLDAPASKVVALEWGEAEMLVTLGVMPVGVADTEGYGTWVTSEQLDDSVVDVGTRAEPSVDSVVALDPDLVVLEETRESNLVEQLEEFVPVLVTTGSDASDNLERMRDDFTMIATAVGKDAEAKRILADFDAALAEGKQKIAAAGAAGQSFVMADGWQDGNAISIRPFGEGALVSQVAIQLGLTNAWQGEVDEVWGLGQTDVEGLTTIEGDDVRFLYNASDGTDVFADGLADNRIWTSLPFVEDGRVHRVTDGIWTFGGPKSCEQYADEIVRIYTS
ncbi:ABC transporter substrate-binding protein [Amycolatopsis cihanbeyliensis]|uniref:Iron complex transport system substrate-binding protein n=1 Tax=Amycolatopsis cihanbeyliensis TaxID=1128664 RepID=A0A542DBV0_AMYCI|nr:iron-siderophore ABC transporter substrate-binding protein [Amycolatopsis cihanbeyliensis]TQJ00549.1 iron complex transport system substrate-binding protein [Amycolatopsis cihanbeyliensis]